MVQGLFHKPTTLQLIHEFREAQIEPKPALEASMEQQFLEGYEDECGCSEPFIGLLRDYLEATPVEKALINYVLLRLANTTIPRLVSAATETRDHKPPPKGQLINSIVMNNAPPLAFRIGAAHVIETYTIDNPLPTWRVVDGVPGCSTCGRSVHLVWGSPPINALASCDCTAANDRRKVVQPQ